MIIMTTEQLDNLVYASFYLGGAALCLVPMIQYSIELKMRERNPMNLYIQEIDAARERSPSFWRYQLTELPTLRAIYRYLTRQNVECPEP